MAIHTTSEMSLVVTDKGVSKIVFNIESDNLPDAVENFITDHQNGNLERNACLLLEFPVSQLLNNLIDGSYINPAFTHHAGPDRAYIDADIKPEVDCLKATLETLINQINSLEYFQT